MTAVAASKAKGVTAVAGAPSTGTWPSAGGGFSGCWRLPPLLGVVGFLHVWSELCARQIAHWRADERMWMYSLEVDDRDWRVLDTLAEMYAKEGRMDESRVYYRRTLETSPPPELGVKPLLQMAKTHIFVGEVDAACTLYKRGSALFTANAFVANNAAICFLRAHDIERAREFFTKGAAVPIVNSMYDRDAVKNNLIEFESWLARGGFKGAGDYHGKLLW